MNHSIVLASNNIVHFAKCFHHLVNSINGKSTELIIVWSGSSNDITAIDKIVESFTKLPQLIHKVISDYGTLGSAWNAGLKECQGDYITLLNDTTIVPNGFLAGLMYCMENFTAMYKTGPVGVVGPVSNYAVKRQQVTLSKKDPHDIRGIQDEINRQIKRRHNNQAPWLVINELSSACIMLRKEVYQQVGGFNDTQLTDETANHDWFLRAANSGYYTVVSGDNYVYRSVKQSAKSFYGHQPATISPTVQSDSKIGFLYRVSINNTYERDVFVQSLIKTFCLTKNIFVIDVNSKVSMELYLKEKWPDLWKAFTKYERVINPIQSSKDYNQLVDWAKQAGMDWVFMLEGDEVVEEKVTQRLLKKLINPVNPHVLGYKCHIYPLWGNENSWRHDSFWSGLSETRLFSLKPGWVIPEGENRKSPKLAPESVRDTSIRLKCYGYVNKEQRELKKHTYELMGINKDSNHPGFIFYKSLLREHEAVLYPWFEERTVSVYAPINKGGQLMDEWFDHLWAFADQIVVGNDGMDETDLHRAQQWGAVVVPVAVKDNFGEARNEIIKECNTSHIFQLDLDERFDDWGELRRHIDHPYYNGWIFSIDNYRKNEKPFTSDTLRLFKNEPGVQYWGLVHESIDDYARSQEWNLNKSSVRIHHYGYVLHPNLLGKMQRYLRLNLEQIRRFPKDGRGYYNLAMHLLEDQIKPEAIMLLKIANALSPRYGLPAEELGRLRLIEAHHWVNEALKSIGDRRRSPYLDNLEKQLRHLLPTYIPSAKGHALIYFTDHAEDFEWLHKHCVEILRTLPPPLRDW